MTKKTSKRAGGMKPVRGTAKSPGKVKAARRSSSPTIVAEFDEVVALIEAARREAERTVNVQLIDLYWEIGALISRRIESDGWGRAPSRSCHPIWRAPNVARAVFPPRTSGECGSFSRRTGTLQISQRW